MVKLALALSLSLCACTDRLLDAKVMHVFPKDGVIQVWIPDHEDSYTVNVEDFSGGVVPESALTCVTLADLRFLPENQRFYFEPPIVGNLGVNVWTMKGCENLNEFGDHDKTWTTMPEVDKDPGLAGIRKTLTEYCVDTCNDYGDCDACDSYTD